MRAAAHPRTPSHRIVWAHLGAGEALRRARRFPKAIGRFAAATHTGGAKLGAELANPIARAWFSVGLTGALAALAFWYAATLGTDEVVARARLELSKVPERALAIGEPTGWRLMFRDAFDRLHVGSITWGLFYAQQAVDAAVGDRVDVELDGGRVRAVRTLARA